MRVLHVISSLDPQNGGPTTAFEGLVLAQRALGLEVTVAASFRSGEDVSMAERLDAAGITYRLVGPTVGPLRRHPRLKDEIDAAVAAAEFVHIHALWEEIQYLAANAAARIGRPMVLRPCGLLNTWSLAQSKWKKRLYLAWRGATLLGRAKAIHCTTDVEAHEISGSLRGTPTIVMRNGISVADYAELPERGTFRRRCLDGFAGPFALHLGRISEKKNLTLAIDAFARAAVAAAKLILVGPGEPTYLAELRRHADAAGVGAQLVISPPLHGPEKLAAFRDANVFVLPSLDENFANALLEAMAVGTPALASPQVALVAEGVRLGAAQSIPLDVASWSRALREALTRPETEGTSRAKVLARFDWRQIADEWRCRYESLAR